MTTEHQASRTLVKSPPELWAECSDAESLVRHLGEFGEIKITRLEPETTVAWEGERASGTVEIEPSGWGTRVTLKVQTNADEVAPPEAALVAPPVTENQWVQEAHPLVEAHSAEESYPAQEAHRAQEAADAKVEETSADPNPAMAADPGLTRRWKRVIDRTRTWFRPRSTSPEVEEPGLEVDQARLFQPASDVEDPERVAREAAEQESDAVTPLPDVAIPVPVATAPSPEAGTPSIDPEAVLSAALDSLGQAHHRPYSRA